LKTIGGRSARSVYTGGKNLPTRKSTWSAEGRDSYGSRFQLQCGRGRVAAGARYDQICRRRWLRHARNLRATVPDFLISPRACRGKVCVIDALTKTIGLRSIKRSPRLWPESGSGCRDNGHRRTCRQCRAVEEGNRDGAKVRHDVMPIPENIVSATRSRGPARCWYPASPFSGKPNKAIVGANAFAHESSIPFRTA